MTLPSPPPESHSMEVSIADKGNDFAGRDFDFSFPDSCFPYVEDSTFVIQNFHTLKIDTFVITLKIDTFVISIY